MTTTSRPAALALLAGAFLLAACAGEGTEPTAPTTEVAAAKGGPNALPSNGRLYFVQTFGAATSEVFSVGQDGSGSRRLTYTDNLLETAIAVSPDGKKLVVTGSVLGPEENFQRPVLGYEIWTMNVDGTNRRRVLSQPCTVQVSTCWPVVADAVFSADGRSIAYGYANETEDIWMISASGSGARKLIDNAHSPAMAPDGKRIAFIKSGPGGQMEMANLDGSGRTPLDNCPTDGGGCVDPAWSPDGSRIVTWTNGGSENRFFSFAFGSVVQPLWMGTSPTWSPDGSAIAGSIGVSTPAGIRKQLTITPVGASAGRVVYEALDIYDVAWGR